MNPVSVAPPAPQGRLDAPAVRLFLLSFTALFLELMVIRWAPSEVRLVAYYANLMLVSSFLGLGIGAIVGPRQWRLFRFFPLLLALSVLVLVGASQVALPDATGEWRFQVAHSKAWSYGILVLVFLLNALVFVPLGEEIGAQFQRLPPLRAYVWDLLGSLCGTVAFGLFSFLHFSPLLGMVLVVGLAGAVTARAARWRSLPFYAVALLAIGWSAARDETWWSPYYFITVRENHPTIEPSADGQAGVARFVEKPALTPPPALRTMTDPPLYSVRVNQDFYQMHGTVDARRYTADGLRGRLLEPLIAQYDVPYRLVPTSARVLVLGAGGGMDVEMALLRGAQRVDAVEIDPVIAALSNRFNAAAPFANPKVVLHIDDARAFLQRDTARYDLVVFGHLDSQALFSYGASLRLDGYTYTVEGFRAAYSRVAERGALVVSFVAGRGWMAQKLVQMIEQATGAAPLTYVHGGQMMIIAPKGIVLDGPNTVLGWTRASAAKMSVDLATDDWPYLYLEKRGIPPDYRLIIGSLLVLSLGALVAFRGAAFGAGDGHFLFLGWGFLLLQTKSIGDCSLYFGTTWLVTTIVIAGVLLMVLLANWAAQRFVRTFHPWLYAPLLVALLVLLAVPREAILAQEIHWRALWTLLVVPLPIFFAGLIFSTTFRESRAPTLSFGANLIGATIGGFCEYLGMWIGSGALSCLVIAAYAASLLCVLRSRAGAAGTA
ncbi:MAG: hypothetical protein NTV51_29160 [Verrucomicrobia bacterium]|nr:hypothetical protein [Verrucomicrobiota bacterium]